MVISLPARIRAGCMLALVVGFSGAGSMLLSHVKLLRPHLFPTVVATTVFGLVFLVRGRWKPVHAEAKNSENNETSESYLSQHPLIFFKRVDFWGWILLASALPILFLTRALYQASIPVEASKAPQQVVRAETPVVPEVVPVEFPPLRLSGFVCNGEKSTVVLDGMTLRIGSNYKGVKVVAVEPSGVTVEMGGTQKRLTQIETATVPKAAQSKKSAG